MPKQNMQRDPLETAIEKLAREIAGFIDDYGAKALAEPILEAIKEVEKKNSANK